jgi:drug/metabolite transporter (DMT)-like permease
VGAAILFLGERWTPRMALGMAIVAGGLAIVQWLPMWLGSRRATGRPR